MLNAVFEALPWPVLVFDEHRTLVAKNRLADTLPGLEGRDLWLRGLSEILRLVKWHWPDGRPVAGTEWPGAGSPVARHDAFISEHTDGRQYRWDVTFTPIRQDQNQWYVLSCRDVTTARQAEEKLRAGAERFRLLFQHSLDAVLVTTPDGSIDEANPAACMLLGRTEEEIRQLGLTGIIDPHAAAADARNQWVKDGQAGAVLTYRRKDGSLILGHTLSVVLASTGPIQHSLVIIREVASRRAGDADPA